MRYDNDAKQMKYESLKKVAELAFNNELDEDHIEQIPFDIIKGSVPHFRCCVYKERAIIRERVRLATGKLLSSNRNGEIITVLPAACEGCPIGRFTVTTNCQRCMAKKCIAACPFGAISVTGNGAYIDQSKCKECGRCAAACPYHAIADTLRPCIRSCSVKALTISAESKRAEIEYDKCISCGACVNNCPFGAISDSSSITKVIEEIKGDKEVYAMFAPAVEGQFGLANVGMIKSAIMKLGFDGVYEVALGADAVSEHEAHDLLEAFSSGRKITTSCCPAFFEMIHKHFPKLVEYISPTVSPMTATARYIRAEHPGSVTVFIGPCIAKKNEIRLVKDSADYVLTLEELVAMFDAKEISPENETSAENSQDGSIYGKGFAQSGGVAGSVMRALEEHGCELDLKVMKCNGAEDCRKALMILNAGRLQEDMIEGMACMNGCVNGPASILPPNETVKNRMKLLKTADDRSITKNLEDHQYSRVKMINEENERTK